MKKLLSSLLALTMALSLAVLPASALEPFWRPLATPTPFI